MSDTTEATSTGGNEQQQQQQTPDQATNMNTDDSRSVNETVPNTANLDDDDAVAIAARSHAMAKSAVGQAQAAAAENERLKKELEEFRRKERELAERQKQEEEESEAQKAAEKRRLIKQAVENAIAEIRDGTGDDDELTQQLEQRQSQMNTQLESCRTAAAVEKVAQEHEPVFKFAHLASQRSKAQREQLRRQQMAQMRSEQFSLMEQMARGSSSGLAVHSGAKRARVEEDVPAASSSSAASSSAAATIDQGTVNASKDSFFGSMISNNRSHEVADSFGASSSTMASSSHTARQMQQDAPPNEIDADPVKVGDRHMFVQAFEDSLRQGVIPSEHDLLRGCKRNVTVVQRSSDGKKQIRTTKQEYRFAEPAAPRITMEHLRPDDFQFMVDQINAHVNGSGGKARNVVSIADIEEAIECSQAPEARITSLADVMG